jgi:hypothetical protein
MNYQVFSILLLLHHRLLLILILILTLTTISTAHTTTRLLSPTSSSSSSSSSSVSSSCPHIGSSSKGSIHLESEDPNGTFGFWGVSAIAVSPHQQGPSGEPILFAVNDRGAGSWENRLGIFDSGTGRRLQTLRFPSIIPTGYDFESMTIGSCGNFNVNMTDDTTSSMNTTSPLTCLYLGDMGDNLARKSSGYLSHREPASPVRIFKILEPIWLDFQDNDEIPEHYFEILNMDYLHPSSPVAFADSEALFMDHSNPGDLYFITKWDSRDKSLTRFHSVPANAWMRENATSVFSPEAYDLGKMFALETWTRAEMSFDGNFLAIGSTSKSYMYVLCPGVSFFEALKDGFCRRWRSFKAPDAFGYEAIAFSPSGDRILQISECTNEEKICNPPIVWTKIHHNHGAICSNSTQNLITMEPSPAPSENTILSPIMSPIFLLNDSNPV